MLKLVDFCILCSLDLASLIALKYTVMDKSLGTVIHAHFECFFNTRYINIRALLTLHVLILRHPTYSVETV